MSNLHNPFIYGKELAPVLDELFEKYTEADRLASVRSYRDEERNRRAERLASAYDRARDQALKARMHSVEAVPVQEAA